MSKSKNKRKELTEKEKLFCALYNSSGNGVQSILESGMNDNYDNARMMAHTTLKRPEIIEYLKELSEEIAEKSKGKILNAQEIKEWWTSVILDTNAFLDSRLKASDMLAKASGLYLERVEITDTIDVKISSIPSEIDE